MSQMINMGNEMLRISPKNNMELEYSRDQGRFWMRRCSASSVVGKFQDLVDSGNELLATTDKGLFYSRDKGRFWMRRS